MPSPAERLIRGAIERHLESPAFAWFVDRRPGRRADKAAPVALLPAGLQERLGATVAVVEMTDRTARRQRRHDVPVGWYAGIQELVDRARPRADGDEWIFERSGRRLALRVRGGVPEVVAYAPVSGSGQGRGL